MDETTPASGPSQPVGGPTTIADAMQQLRPDLLLQLLAEHPDFRLAYVKLLAESPDSPNDPREAASDDASPELAAFADKLDGTIFSILPSAKENPLHFAVANHCLVQQLESFPEADLTLPLIERLAELAAYQAKAMLSEQDAETDPEDADTTDSKPPEASPLSVFSEGAQNWVQARPQANVSDIAALIKAHLKHQLS